MTARAARKLGVDTVVGFTGSSIWKYVAMFPPASQSLVDAGYEDFANRWNPILDVFDAEGVRFAHEVHPREIAYDYWTTTRALEAVGHREAFGLNWDPSHFVWQDLDPVGVPLGLQGPDLPRRLQGREDPGRQRPQRPDGLAPGLGRPAPRLGLRLHRPRRRAVGAVLPDAQHDRLHGPISVEWEDAGMDRLVGAPEALEFVRAPRLRRPGGRVRRRVQHESLTPVSSCAPRRCSDSTPCPARWFRPGCNAGSGRAAPAPRTRHVGCEDAPPTRCPASARAARARPPCLAVPSRPARRSVQHESRHRVELCTVTVHSSTLCSATPQSRSADRQSSRRCLQRTFRLAVEAPPRPSRAAARRASCRTRSSEPWA